ncbi:MAG: amidase [Desulfobacterales bacterium]|nr:MAG: amidase [Desulfobacterales bacterium]
MENGSTGMGSNTLGVTPPTLGELEAIAKQYYLNLSREDLTVYQEVISGAIGSYRRVAELEEPKLPVKYPRSRGYRPSSQDNPLNAWYWRCAIQGANTGRLAGKKIALKDNICVAGIPMMNGSSVLEGFVPDVDATVATRILDAGGEIIGKAVCEDLCFSGGSFTSATGPVLNPHNPKFNAGGSSSGSAALVVNGDCDMAMGGDQGGSIRIPSSWSGAYGLKPTHGLVPYTGIFPIEATLDHTGPMAMTVENVALLLAVVAGKDPLDPRQSQVVTKPYPEALTGDVKDLKFGIVKEGFGWPGASQEDVDLKVRQAADEFKKLGAEVVEISIPMHRDGIHIWNAIATEGALGQMILHDGMGLNWQGYYTTGIVDYYGRARRVLADNFSDTVKFVILLGQYMANKYYGRYYAKAQNLVPVLTQAYDDALKQVDLLLMPTTPMKAMPIPANPTTGEYFGTALGMIQNTCPFDCTHHPAMNVPCAKSDGLPVGMMLIGRHFEEDVVLRAAHAFEKAGIYS